MRYIIQSTSKDTLSYLTSYDISMKIYILSITKFSQGRHASSSSLQRLMLLLLLLPFTTLAAIAGCLRRLLLRAAAALLPLPCADAAAADAAD